MQWIKQHWQWVTLNLCGLAMMANLLWSVIMVNQLDPNYDLVFLSSGKWAIRFLLL